VVEDGDSILDQTIVASAAAPIARDLHAGGATHEIPWLIAAYTLAATCVGPLYGKLADRHGSRPVFLTALGLFLAGSALCAAAGSLGELIAFRALQGLGGGGLMALAIVVLGQLRADEEAAGTTDAAGSRGNLAGAALVGIGLVLGPTVGGQIVEHVSWRWVFLVNLPLGGAALAAAWWALPRRAPATRGRVDGLGAGLLAAAAAALLLGCEWGGTRYAWDSPAIIGLGAVALAAVVGFGARQLRAAEPLVPLRVIGDRSVRVIALLQLLAGIGMAGSAIYVTLTLQIVHHVSPAGTGVRLLPMAAGLACGSLVGRRLLRGGQAPLTAAIAVGCVASAVGYGVLALTGVGTPYALLAGLLWLLGAGIGVGMGTEVVILQRVVDPAHLGIATASVRFAQELGTSLAAAGMGVLFSTRVSAAAGHSLASAVAGATRPVFALSALTMAVAAVAAARLPIALDSRRPAPGPAPAPATGPGDRPVTDVRRSRAVAGTPRWRERRGPRSIVGADARD
jgi:MFS family permease